MAVSKVILNGNTLIDATTATATADDIIAPLTAMLANGVMTTGTGSSGLEYETGTYTTTTDTTRPTINFSNTHAEMPVVVFFYDATGTYLSTTSTNFFTLYVDYAKMLGSELYASSTSKEYVFIYNRYRTSTSTFTGASINCGYSSDDTESSSSAYPRYWVTNSCFYPSSNSPSRYWRPDRTYKWIAIWKPVT